MNLFNIVKLVFLFNLALFFTGCSQKITIKAIQPSVVHDKDIKRISIDAFQNDTISLSANILSKINNTTFNGKHYFTVVNRKDIEKILKEQKIQDSGLVNSSEYKQFDLGEVNAIITGTVNNITYNKDYFYEVRTNYDICIKTYIGKNGKKYCSQYKKYNVYCTKHNYSIDAQVSISRVSNSNIIYSQNYIKVKQLKKCNDYSKSIPPKQLIYDQLSKSIANEFVETITPTYKYFKVTLLEDEDIDYTIYQENLLENSLKLIELGSIDEANALLQKLVYSTKSKSYVALYNLAVTFESLGQLDSAYNAYKKAKLLSLQNKVIEEIINSVQRIQLLIQSKKEAEKQISD
jgi:hypothetical protein